MQDSSRAHSIRCWEWLSCGRDDCDAHGSEDLHCWLTENNSCFDRMLQVRERLLSKCAECPVYAANRMRSRGQRHSDRAVLDTLDALLAETAETASRLEKAESESRGKSTQVTLLSEVGRALQSTMEIDDVLLVILTAVTAGDGLGFNRAFLLLVDESGSTIRGRMAVGPTHPTEADMIWRTMAGEGRNLGQILSEFSAQGKMANRGIMRLAKRLVYPLDGARNIIAKSLNEGTSHILENADQLPEAREIAQILENDHFLVVPLVAKGRRLGCIIADNFVTKRPIRDEDVRLLETFASQAALAILNASLHTRLRERLRQLEEAHRELSQNQLQLLRAERMVAAGGLAATFIHDLKAPLISIGLMARAAASDLPEGNPAREKFEKIAGEIVEIEKYLRDLARSAEEGQNEPESIDISELIESSLELMRGLMITTNVENKVEFNHSETKITGNMVELRQVILNLLCNSVEAMPDGGNLAVTTQAEGNWVKISVEDTGGGIPEAAKATVFSPFATTKPGGSGLGLAIAKRIINDHGGKISFESKEGTGTCFSILLPAR